MHEIASASERGHLLYFAQGDSHLRTFMPRRSSLVSDLMNRLMLEPGVVILDSLFLTSDEIAQDLKKPARSPIWHGLREGLIVPAFREKGVDSFEENYRQGIVPTTSIGIRDDAPEIVSTLDVAIKGKHTGKLTWPAGIGISYGKLITEQFGQESNNSDSWGVKQIALWKQSHDLRHKYLDVAWRHEPNPKQTGLRRSTILTAIATDLGFDGDPLDTAGLVGSADKARRAALRATLLWIDELYNYNQATRFKIKPSFPVATGSGAHMMPDLLWPGPKQVPDTAGVKVYSSTIRWPNPKMLSSASPDVLLSLRADKYGADYIASLKEFRGAPNDQNWQVLDAAANTYAERVCKAVASDVDFGMQISHFVADNGITIAMALAAAAGGGLALAGAGVAAGIVTLISTFVGTAYVPVAAITKGVRGRYGEVTLTGTGGKLGQIRMDLPTK
ncbi:MAG TPA: hypothetical protein VMA73_29690 [Streptosporangiaceae bacterium]|nr:hypothetical protein [Streptosporangiaceae bacterium]